jgi:hypothetical protein
MKLDYFRLYFQNITQTAGSPLIKVADCFNRGHAVVQLVEAQRYKPEGRRFDSRCCNWNFSLA